VLPDAQDPPPGTEELGVVSPVSIAVPRQLGIPPLSVNCWTGAVVRARMPEAPVEEDGQARSGEDDVHSA
jgi:hypothetical protein